MTNKLMDVMNLVDEIQEHGWQAFTVAGGEVDGDEKPDVVAIKNGYTLMFKVVILESGSSRVDVSSKSGMLANRVSGAGDGTGRVNGYFAINKKKEGEWYVEEYTANGIYYKYNHRPLTKVLMKA